MPRVLTLSTLFPNAAEPTLGVFVERQTLGLTTHPDVELEVVSSVGLPPWPLTLHPHYAGRARLPREEQWKGLKVHHPRYTVWPGLGAARTARSMAKALLPVLGRIRERFAFEVIDAEFFWPDGPAAMHLAKAFDVPFSIKARGADIHYWGCRPGIAGQVLEAALAADGLLAVSEAMKADMVSLGIPAEKIRVHYTGVDLDRFHPVDHRAAKAALGIEGPLIAVAGALIPRKRQRLALEALELIPEASMIVIGDGPDRHALEAFVRARGLGRRVRFLGRRPHEELPTLLAAADVMLLPSRSEGLANVWVEALACGTPVVTTDAGGARELIVRPEQGRIADAEPRALASAVRDVLADPPDPPLVRRSVERFTWDRNRDALHEHLTGLIG